MDGTLTDQSTGIELFKRWIMDMVPAPPAELDALSSVELHHPEDLPAMIKVLREAELACLTGLNEFNQRTHEERQRAEAEDPAQRARRETTMSTIVRTQTIQRWHSRITWLQDVRRYLEGQLQPGEAVARLA